jgi:hypothetical protein
MEGRPAMQHAEIIDEVELALLWCHFDGMSSRREMHRI